MLFLALGVFPPIVGSMLNDRAKSYSNKNQTHVDRSGRLPGKALRFGHADQGLSKDSKPQKQIQLDRQEYNPV